MHAEDGSRRPSALDNIPRLQQQHASSKPFRCTRSRCYLLFLSACSYVTPNFVCARRSLADDGVIDVDEAAAPPGAAPVLALPPDSDNQVRQQVLLAAPNLPPTEDHFPTEHRFRNGQHLPSAEVDYYDRIPEQLQVVFQAPNV